MVFEPLYEPLWMLQRRFEGNTLPPDVLKPIIRLVIMGLDYLHTQARVVHTGNSSNLAEFIRILIIPTRFEVR